VIWLNGHSHYEYSMQVYNENLNLFDYQGTTATMIHVPSVTNPRTVKPESTSYSSLRGKTSQGALHCVYDSYNIMNGMNLWNDEIQSYACYIIYTDPTDIIKCGTLENGISWTFDKQTCSLRILGNGDLIPTNNPPWAKYSEDIFNLYVGKGITSIAPDGFCDLINLRSAELKDGIRSIGSNAFYNCRLDRLILPESLEYIEENAFSSEYKICSLIYDSTAEKWECVSIGNRNSAIDTDKKTFRKVQITFTADNLFQQIDVPIGKIPAYEDIPVKDHPDNDKYYVFVGWSCNNEVYPAAEPLPPANENRCYTAVFGAQGNRFVTGDLSFGEILWTLDRRTSTLTVSGKGVIPDFTDLGDRPWDAYKNGIATIIVSTGITDIGANAFKQFPALKKVVIEPGVKSIGNDGLAYNKLLKNVHIPRSLTYLGRGSVYSSDFIEKVYYGGSPDEWKSFCNGITTYYNTNLTNTKDVVYFS
ncbi:MAG: hypothetical protein E7675_04330, partial [Ruminococcaceae bacterium]|nr:hypothetical protein [Oscillospiraceae bacterium]